MWVGGGRRRPDRLWSLSPRRCGRAPAPPPRPPVSSSSGRQLYATHCVVCHGEGGRGDGPSAAGFATKPSDLTDGRLMNRLPDEFLVNIILHGGPAEGLSPNMPPFAGYLGEAQARDIIAHLRSLAQPPFTAGSAPPPGDGPRGSAPADPLQPPDPRRLVPDRLPVLPRRRPALGVRRAALGGALHGLPQDHRSPGQPGDRQDPRLQPAAASRSPGSGCSRSRSSPTSRTSRTSAPRSPARPATGRSSRCGWWAPRPGRAW